ncbi:hypothetical protein [Bacillus sp. ISL-37]|jgi:hypothetical protein|uniref:hypothetical protein n=1 Tax=Bacillus sp. ISL-37 TaxID=2819123 RepID=UPI001BE4E1A6|nr:hypothetical protein [Bacillus sp. ISL-37]MBT2684561.1 hypothetical protein [Bacillus sp. ISL-37]
MKSFFDFIGRHEIEMCSRLSRNAETGDPDKEAHFASAGGVEVSEFLGGETRQATRGARRWSWIKKTTCSYPHLNNFIIFLTNRKKGSGGNPLPSSSVIHFFRLEV